MGRHISLRPKQDTYTQFWLQNIMVGDHLEHLGYKDSFKIYLKEILGSTFAHTNKEITTKILYLHIFILTVTEETHLSQYKKT
jgi:hypothetical protein